MVCGTERFMKPGRGVPADGQQPVSQPNFMQMPHPLEAFTNSDGHRPCLRFTRQLSEFLNELVGLGVLDVEAHDLPFYQEDGTRVAYVYAVPELDTRGALTRLWEHLKKGHKQRLYGWFQQWAGIEAQATVLRWCEPLAVPGLLQTEEVCPRSCPPAPTATWGT